MIEMKGQTRMLIFTCNARDVASFYEAGTPTPDVRGTFCMFCFCYVPASPAHHVWLSHFAVTTAHPHRKPSVKASVPFFCFSLLR